MNSIGRIAIAAVLLVSGVTLGRSEDLPSWLEGRELEPTYDGGIGLIFEHRCNRCHRPGEIAPMSFLDYDELRSAAGGSYTPLEALIATREMPPWPADPSVGAFANSLLLTPPEIDLLIEWAEDDMPYGDDEFESETEWVEGWGMGRPDHVFELPRYVVPSDADAHSKEFIVETDFPEDRWIVAAEARPGDQYLVTAIEGGPLGSYRSGNSFQRYPPGAGRLLKAGEKIAVRVHYLKEKGYEAADGSRLGVVFAKDTSGGLKNLNEDRMAAPAFTIPAGAENFEVRARFEFPRAGEIFSLMPVMGLRGKDVSVKAILPDGSEIPLLSIPRWDQLWKFRYQLAEPLAAPAGTVVVATAHFDNSESNPRNPDHTVQVESGPGGEVFEGWIGYSLQDSRARSK